MKTQSITLFEVGMQVVWIDEIPKEEGVELLTDEQMKESVSDRRKEISMAASRVYTSCVRLLEKLKKMYGAGPFDVLQVSAKSISNEVLHPQHVTISCKGNSQISGYWLRVA